MSRESRLERLVIPLECRTVKDWFATRESAEAALPAIRAHIQSTGQTHTCFCHTHTKPAADAIPVYIGEFVLPEKYIAAKRFCPCPCCWEEFGKFGRGKIAWFPMERVIRLIGEDCFASLNPEAHAEAQRNFDIEKERKRNSDFLLANLPRLPQVIATIDRAIVVAKAVDALHAQLHSKLKVARLDLWPYVRHEGKLMVNVREQEFRRGVDREMHARDVDVSRAAYTLPGYQMLDPSLGSCSEPLEAARRKIAPYAFDDAWQSSLEGMSDEERRVCAVTLSRAVKKAKEKIAEIEELRRFAEPVAINTLRNWGAHDGCPIPYNYSYNGDRISFGKSEYVNLAVVLLPEIRNHIGQIEFWTDLERWRQ